MRPASSQTEGIGLVRPLAGSGHGLSMRTIYVFLFFLVQGCIVLNIPRVFYNHHTVIILFLALISGLLIVLARRRLVVSLPLAILVLAEVTYFGIGTLTALSLEPELSAVARYHLRISPAVALMMYGSAVAVPEVFRHLGVKATLTCLFSLLLVGTGTIFFTDFLYESIESLSLSPQFHTMHWEGVQRGVYISPAQVVIVSGMLATISLVFLGRRQKGAITNAGYIGLAVAVLGILISASKTGFVALTVLFITFLILGNQMRKIRMISLFLCVIAGLVIIVPMGLANRFINVRHFTKFAEVVTVVTGGVRHSGSAIMSNRDILWKRSFDAFLKSPIVGHGLSAFEDDPRVNDFAKFLRYWDVLHTNPAIRVEHSRAELLSAGAHNMFLLLAADAGFAPASLLILFWLIVAYSALFRMSGPAKELTMGFSIFMFCLALTTTGQFQDPISFGSAIGLVCGFINYQKNQSFAAGTTRRLSS